MRQLHCIDEKPFAFPFFCTPFNFRLSNWTNLLLYASIHSFLHFDVWSISTKIHDKPQGESGIICYLHCISKVRNSVLVLPDIKAGSFSWSSTKLPRFSVLIKKSRGFFFFSILSFPQGQSNSENVLMTTHNLCYFGTKEKTTLTISTVTLTQKS